MRHRDLEQPLAARIRRGLVASAVMSALAAAAGCGAAMPASVTAWRAGLASAAVPDGSRVTYVDAGPRDGEVIVLLHGLPTSSYLYHQIIPALTARGYRVIAPDLVGFGGSSKPEAQVAYEFGRQADRLLALFDQLHVARFNLVVHDLGGLVAWEMLDRQPARPLRMLVMNTTAYPGFEPPAQMRMLAGPLGGVMSAMMGGGPLGRSLTGTFITDNTASPDHVDDATVDSFWWSLHEGTTTPMRAMAQGFGRVLAELPRYQAALRRFAGPAMVLWGARDRILGFAAMAPKFAADLRIPAERVRAIDDAGHFLMLDHPERVSAAILELAALPASIGQADRVPDSRPFEVAGEAPPPPGPSASVALDLTDRIATEPAAHDVRLGARMRSVLGGRPGYAFGLDAAVGSASGLAYRAAASPVGVGYAGGGHLITLIAGVGVHGAPGVPATLEIPVTLDLALQLGPVRALGWARAAWLTAGVDAMPWELAFGLRLGSARPYFPGAVTGAGPYLAAIVNGAGAARSYGVALGVELGDGR